MKKTILVLLSITILYQTTFSETFNPKFTEVSLKNKTADFITIELPDNFSNDLEIKDDSLLVKISPTKVKTVTIYFKSESEKEELEGNHLKIYITKKGLTGTTEQLTLFSNGKLLDMVCWENLSPPASEQKDFEELDEYWEGPCINSEEIPNNKSISRIAEEKNSKSWEINNKNNNPPKAIITIQKGPFEGEIPFSLNLDGGKSEDPDGDKLIFEWTYPDDQFFNTKNPPSFKFEKPGNYTITLKVSDGIAENSAEIKIVAKEKSAKPTKTKKSQKLPNGTLSDLIEFTEVFPNPSGKDSKKEWIELYNSSNQKVNLQNWQIENNSKKKPLKNLSINPKEYILIKDISLKNSATTLKLLDFQNKVIDEMTYAKTKESLSLNKIITQKEAKWLFLKPNPLLPPPRIENIKGTIISPPEIAEEFFFKIQTAEQKVFTINFREPFNFKKLETELPKDTPAELSIEKENEKYFLLDYKVEKIKKPEETTSGFNYFILIPILLIGGVLYMLK